MPSVYVDAGFVADVQKGCRGQVTGGRERTVGILSTPSILSTLYIRRPRKNRLQPAIPNSKTVPVQLHRGLVL
jgi:hypothetical protein